MSRGSVIGPMSAGTSSRTRMAAQWRPWPRCQRRWYDLTIRSGVTSAIATTAGVYKPRMPARRRKPWGRDPAADIAPVRVRVECACERHHPIVCDAHVVVGERDDRRARGVDAGVARVREPLPRLEHVAKTSVRVLRDRAND